MKETPGQIFAVVKWNMFWEKPSVHNPAKVKVNIYFRVQLITLPLRVLLYSYHSQTPIPHTTIFRSVSPSMLIVNRGTIEVRTEGNLRETIQWFTMGDVLRMDICMKSNAAISYMYNVDGNNCIRGKLPTIDYKCVLKWSYMPKPPFMYWFRGTSVFKSRVGELKSHWTDCKMKRKTQINRVSNKREKKEIKTWESRPSIGLNYLLLIRISNNIHEVPGRWSPWYWGPSSPDKIIVRFSGLTKGVMLLLIGCKTGGQFEFKSSIWKL